MSSEAAASSAASANDAPQSLSMEVNEARVYQDRVVQTFMNSGPEDLVLCQACAGAGKTTTILRVVDELRKERPESCVLLTSFAKATIANFKDKAKKELGRDVDILPFLMENDIAVSKRPGLFATHLHAIGKALVPRGVSKDAAMKEADRVFKINRAWKKDQEWGRKFKVSFAKALEFYLQNLGTEFDSSEKMAATWAKFLKAQWVPDVVRKEIFDNLPRSLLRFAEDVPFSGLLLAPVQQEKKVSVDVVIVDEAQDLTYLEMQLLSCVVGPNTKVLAVGDQYQMLYAFRGVEFDSLQLLADVLRKTCKKTSLPFCLRCPSSHIKLAQQYVPADIIEAAPKAKAGTVRKLGSLKEAQLQLGDLVLVPSNAEAITQAFDALGKELASKVSFRVIPSIKQKILQLCKKGDLPAMREQLEQELKYADDEDKNGIMAFKKEFLLLMEKLDITTAEDIESFTRHTLYAVDLGVSEEDEVEEEADSQSKKAKVDLDLDPNVRVDKEDPKRRVWFSTVHGAKGFESDRVFWAPPKPSADEAKRNEAYVALTRSTSTLVLLGESGFAR